MNLRIIIIGAGIAGLTAAKEIRTQTKEAEIILISKENALPYYRLSLTRYMAGELDKKTLPIQNDEWYAQNGIELITGREVITINRSDKQVVLSDHGVLNYDRLILASGARPMVPPIPGSGLKNVLTVRTLEDAELLLAKLKENQSCIAIGGGLLGLETAGAIVKSGIDVTLLEVAPWLLPRQLNQKAAGLLKKKVESTGIKVREGVRIANIVGSEACEGIQLDSGEFIPSKLVVITAGIIPETQLAKAADLSANKGVIVDAYMRTSDASIFAAGDLTEYNGALGGLWNIAQQQGKIAGLNAIGIETPYVPAAKSHNLKVLGLDVFSMGDLNTDEGTLFYEILEPERYLAFVINAGIITGAIVIGDRPLSMKVKSAIEKKKDFSEGAVASVEDLIKLLG